MKKMTLNNHKSLSYVLLVLFFTMTGTLCFGQFGGGGGTAVNPYLIGTATHLNNIRDHMTAHFRQTADIDLLPEELTEEAWYSQELGWLPIGTTGDGGFRGSYDGNGFQIHNMRMNRPAMDNAGIFGYTVGARLVSIGLVDAQMTARSWVGAMVGRLDGGLVTHSYHEGGWVHGHSRVGGLVGLGFNGTELHYCYSTADAIGDENHVASLVGFFSVGCFMTNSYATGNASGLSRVGGLIGKAYLAMGATVGAVRNCYSTGWVDSPDVTLSGGLFGRSVIAGHVFDCFWNTETSGKTYGGQNIPLEFGKTTAQMLQAGTYAPWNFIEEDGIWAISAGTYPYLQWQNDTPRGFNYPSPFALTAEADADIVSLGWSNPPVGNPLSYNVYRDGEVITNVEHPANEFDDETVDNYVTYQYHITAVYGEGIESAPSNKVNAMPYYFAGGTGTQEDPFLIDEVSQLNGVRFLLSSHFRQIANLDLVAIPNWLPIGTNTIPFTGSYRGGGYQISNMTINRPTTSYVGLFGYLQAVTVDSLLIENVSINGNQYIGGLAGYLMSSNVTGCIVSGTIASTNATSYAGGITGYQNQTTIAYCSFDGSVTGNNYLGGITSYKVNAPSVINNSFAKGEVRGANYVAGMIGWAGSGNGINNSYSTVNVTGTTYVAGLMGYQAAACQITNSYSTGAITGTGSVGGLTGGGGAATVTNSYWNVESSGRETSWRGTPKTTEEMVAQETFVAWNFAAVWGIQEGLSYPYLLWQGDPEPQNIPGPTRLTAAAGNAVVNLSWFAPFFLVPQSYNVYRNGEYLGSVDHPEVEYADEMVNNFTTYSYYVTALYEEEVESGASNSANALPYTFAGGQGTAEDPYQVASDQQLNHIRHILNGHYVQVEDIDLGVEPWTIGQGWVPLGNETAGQRFTGSYNGDRFVIENLYIDRFRVRNYQGLFGYIENASLKKVGVVDCYVRGDYYVGGLAAYVVNSTIDSCFVTGEVEGSFYTGGMTDYASNSRISNCFSSARVRGGHYTGGLVNRTFTNSVVSNSYATGFVYGAGNQVGGFMGNNGTGCTVVNCYSTGQVWAIDIYGGLLGVNNGAVTNSYWNVETSAQPTSAGGTGRTTVQMVRQATFQPGEEPVNHWDFDDLWNINEDETYPWLRYQGEAGMHNYPTLVPPSNLVAVPSNNQVNLRWQAPVLGAPTHYNIYRGGVQQATVPAAVTQYEQGGLENHRSYHYTVTAVYADGESGPSNEEVVVPFPGFAGGSGTVEEPFQIATATQLNDIRLGRYRRLNFIQTANIDVGGFNNWVPLGSTAQEEQFTGTYDGGGYTIANLTITGNDTYRGLFGYLQDATIRNVGLVDVSISGGTYTAAFAGWTNNSTFTNCYVTGEINGTGTGTAGLVGYISTGTVNFTGCYADITLEATGSYTGGLVGYATGTTTFTDCYTRGTIATTGNYTGGLVGYLAGTSAVISSFSNVDIQSTNSYVGGLVAYSNRPIADSYALGAVAGTRYVGGLVGQQAGSTITDCFSAGRVSSENEVDIGGLLGANTGEVTNSYWDRERAGIEASAGGAARDTRQMTYPYDLVNAFIRWDFEETWAADERFVPDVNPGMNEGYPYLQWQVPELLDTPQVTIAFNIENQAVLSWEEIEGANSYKIFASANPFDDIDEWTLIATTDETTYTDDDVDPGLRRFYRVIASSQEARRQRWAPSPVIPNPETGTRSRRAASGASRSVER